MIGFDAKLDGVASAAYTAAIKEYAASLGAASASAPRRAAIQMCKNFRAATREAKKRRPMNAAVSGVAPQWITYKDGRKLDKPLRRFIVTLTDRGKTFTRYAHGGSRAEMMNQLRKQVGTLYRQKERKGGTRGLAKQSWGWVMHNIFSGSAPDAPWQRRKNDHRAPKDATKESMSRETKGTKGIARIVNRLDYIRDALKISEDQIIGKATRAIVSIVATKRLRAGGMSSADIKNAAKQIARDFQSQFPD